MSNVNRLLKKAGGNIAESLGGEGVEAMLAAAPAAASGTGSTLGRTRNRTAGIVDINLVIPDPDQPRRDFNPEDLQRLADSLKKRGQLQNVRVRFSEHHQKWMLISGERRYRAALLAGLTTLKAEFVEHDLSDTEKLEDAIVENCLREDLNAVELAQAYSRLMELRGYTAKELAAELHVSAGSVSKTLAVLKLPDDLRQQVAEGTLPRVTAYEISRLGSEDEQRAMAARVAGGEVSREQIVGTVHAAKGRRSHAASKTGKRLACTLPQRGSVTVAADEELTFDSVIGLLAELLRVAKKAKADGLTLDALPELLKELAGKKRAGRKVKEAEPVGNAEAA